MNSASSSHVSTSSLWNGIQSVIGVTASLSLLLSLAIPAAGNELSRRVLEPETGDINEMIAKAQQDGEFPLPEAPDADGVDVVDLAPAEPPSFENEAVVTRAADVEWPRGGSAEVAVDSIAGAVRQGRAVEVGGLPMRVGLPNARGRGSDTAAVHVPARVGLEVASQAQVNAAGVRGVVMGVRSAASRSNVDGIVEVEIDYSDFRHAYGGDWASRLRVRQLSGCDGTELDLAAIAEAGVCAGEELDAENDLAAGMLTVPVPVAGNGGVTVLAISAGDAGDNGDYTATDLSPAGTWQVSEQTGAFAWSYPLRVVPGVGGPEPSLALSYSSQSVDGRTSNTNSQGSWIGDGWDLWPGYVERSYQSCSADEGKVGGQDPNNKGVPSGDLCWVSDNATMSLNGSAVELVKGSDGRWRGTDDDGTRVEQLFAPSWGNGTHNGEYWKATTPNGTQFFFGRHRRAGYPADSAATNSTWTVPVYGNHPGEPCYQAGSFSGSRCTQGWRWNLDYVQDPHGNTMSLFYTRETGAYGREADPAKRTTYHRGGYLSRIEYGTRAGTEDSALASARVVFDVADRCLPGETCSQSNPQAWPDVPWDRYCAAAPCTDQLSPTFWTQKRLATIRAQVRRSGSWSTVESWALRHDYLDAGASDGEGVPMWLAGLTRTGHVTTAGGAQVSDPEIVFDPGSLPLANRVDGPSDGKTELNRWRLNRIWTESGAIVNVSYSQPECTTSNLPTPHTNGKRCFPQWYGPSDDEPTLDWFHKYVVTQVTVEDVTGASPRMETHYQYLDAPAWRYDDSELVAKDKRTWSQWRGYSKVRVLEGLAAEQQSAVEYLYMRGMHGDRATPSGGTKSVTITDSQGDTITDHEAHAGFLREQTVLDGPGGAWVEGSINTPWRHGPTATLGPLKSYMTDTATVRTRTKLEGGGARWTRTITTFDTTYGMPIEVDDRGDESTTADDRCTRYSYARNTSLWIVDKISRTETVGVRCSVTPSRPADVLADERVFYDNPDTFGAAPTRGLPVKVQEVGSWNGSTPVWMTTERSTYDAQGRVRDAFDALDRRTRTTYSPSAGGPLTAVTVLNPAGHLRTDVVEPAWSLPVSITDVNGRVTELTYDGAGRLARVWLPGRDRASESPNLRFSYLLRKNAPSAVTSETLLPDGVGYVATVSLFDGMLRERQMQTRTHGGGRVITDTIYDSRGLVEWEAESYYDSSNSPPSTTLVQAGKPQIPGVTEYLYDGAGRVTDEIFLRLGQEQWRTSYAYGGDRTHVTPPAGETATTEISDARGNVTALRQYHGPAPTGTYDETTYTYTLRDELASITDAVGNTWTYTYDQRGRKIAADDPDLGGISSTYDDAGQVLTETDGRGVSVGYTYDSLGRKTSVRDGSPTGALRASWEFDSLPGGVGLLARSTRYEGGAAYVSEIMGYTDAGLPTGTRVTIPESETGLSGTYETTHTYHADGSPYTTTLPAAGDLAAETMVTAYDDVGAPTWLVSALSVYVGTVSYSKLGDLTQRRLGNFGKRTVISYTWDDATRRLTNTAAMYERPSGPVETLDLDYTYDPAGNLTRIADSPGSATPNDTQCYRYDHLRRMTNAWTPLSTAANNCDGNPGPIGGPAPYRLAWTYDATGNRLTQNRIGPGAGATTYTHPSAGQPRPHAVTEAVTTGPSGTTVNTYAYDDAGNMTQRGVDGSTQTLTWDAEGRVTSITDQTSGATEFVYDAEGERLIRRDTDGATLYLYGSELRWDTATTDLTCTRYYEHLGTTVAVRTSTSLAWLVNDHHQTGEVAINDASMTHQRRRTLPFGETRGPNPASWPTDKGFVGGTIDPTGLTHLGARLYDQTLGRFISVDPIIDYTDPQQMHGYSYSNNNPTTFTDPDGLWFKKAMQKVATVADAVSGVTGVAATVAAFIPGAQPVAAALALVSVTTGVVGTAAHGSLGNGRGVVEGVLFSIPGGKALQGARQASKLLKNARASRSKARAEVGVEKYKERLVRRDYEHMTRRFRAEPDHGRASGLWNPRLASEYDVTTRRLSKAGSNLKRANTNHAQASAAPSPTAYFRQWENTASTASSIHNTAQGGCNLYGYCPGRYTPTYPMGGRIDSGPTRPTPTRPANRSAGTSGTWIPV